MIYLEMLRAYFVVSHKSETASENWRYRSDYSDFLKGMPNISMPGPNVLNIFINNVFDTTVNLWNNADDDKTCCYDISKEKSVLDDTFIFAWRWHENMSLCTGSWYGTGNAYRWLSASHTQSHRYIPTQHLRPLIQVHTSNYNSGPVVF